MLTLHDCVGITRSLTAITRSLTAVPHWSLQLPLGYLHAVETGPTSNFVGNHMTQGAIDLVQAELGQTPSMESLVAGPRPGLYGLLPEPEAFTRKNRHLHQIEYTSDDNNNVKEKMPRLLTGGGNDDECHRPMDKNTISTLLQPVIIDGKPPDLTELRRFVRRQRAA